MTSPEERHEEAFDLIAIRLEEDAIPPNNYIVTIQTLDGLLHFLATWDTLAKLRQQLIDGLPDQKPPQP